VAYQKKLAKQKIAPKRRGQLHADDQIATIKTPTKAPTKKRQKRSNHKTLNESNSTKRRDAGSSRQMMEEMMKQLGKLREQVDSLTKK